MQMNEKGLTPDGVYQLVQLAAAKVRPQLTVELGDGDVARIAKAAEVKFRERPQSIHNIVMIAAAGASTNMLAAISKSDVATIAKQAEIEHQRRHGGT